jgi:hypothetical protein
VLVFAPPNATSVRGTAARSIRVPIAPAQSGGTLDGSLEIRTFVADRGRLVVQGVFTGSATVAGSTNTLVAPAEAAVSEASGSSTTLDLSFGRLNLDQLGLVVELTRVHLTIAARGEDDLLGTLLSEAAYLVDSSPSGQGLAAVLNRLLDTL